MKKRLWVLLVILVFGIGLYIWQDLAPGQSSKEFVTEVLKEAGIQIDGPNPWDITVHDDRFYPRIIAEGSMGLGETYMEGMWECLSIDQFVYRLLTAKVDEKADQYTWKKLWQGVRAKIWNLQNKSKSQEVINIHYNLGNDLFEKMLGPSMAYSCGYWENAKNLTQAQQAKYNLICRKLKLEPGMTILDIGCGFGGFAYYAATHYKVTIVGITLSENQAKYARELCKGLPVEIQVQDYRDLSQTFDRIVSIGMFEHVGPKNYAHYMQIVHQCLKETGLFLLHTIGGNASTNTGDPWISTYIFPGGVLPSIAEIGLASENLFVMEDWHNFGLDYDKTLLAWHANFESNWPALSTDYNQTFYRMWNYYLLSCAAAFRARECQLWQVVFSKNRFSPQYIREL